ncbi:U2 small nuclear ribonucleoprotein B [Tieghemostelium lacteum]|uniref:U2 small nuclear ribonucleoprotein B n=1 Tax=Tieghemostelium lacteum TaxID=361077 RepID=A0A151ZGL6_TIELA|nr:U2 small nuclear ribonucleoprotein B [Tieghemostelium lacteum]|eukprot:KYQ93020.1 U2 small nuclear ribonucleoprotein B [Tieghemostelium lacteum]
MAETEAIKVENNDESNVNNNTTPIEEDKVDIPPNQTIYINNLYEKISKKKLVEQLYSLFTKYGSILEIIASKSDKKRGQAFVVFQDLTSASNALREMNGFKFLDKPMRIQYSKNKSDAVAKLDGTYMEKKRQRENDREQTKSKKLDTGGNKKSTGQSKKAVSAPPTATTSISNSASLQPRDAPPNKDLFIENLPDKCEPMMLQMLFSQFEGFKDVTMIPGRKGIAFVMFEDEIKSANAMNHLQHFKVSPEKPMVISFMSQ